MPASSGNQHSVTILIQQLRSGKPADFQAAAREIWTRYFESLLQLARQHLSPRIRRRVDEEDVLQSMYKSFCLRLARGEYALSDRTDLWRLLTTITLNKVRNAVVHHSRRRRDVQKEQAVGAGGEDTEPGGEPQLDDLPQSDPTPAEAAILVEALEKRLSMLDESLRKIALWKLQGFTNEEIAGADKMDCAVRTVERKLALIRDRWAQSEGQAD